MRLRNFFFVCLCAFILLPVFSFASTSPARQTLETAITSVLNDLSDPQLRTDAGRSSVLKRVEITISNIFNFEELSARTVGPNWRNFTAPQQQRFIDVFTDLLRETYLERFADYSGETVSYLGETASSNGNRVEIQTSIKVKGSDVPVSYRMLNKGKWQVYDIIIEGVSLVQNFRSQFQSVLLKGSPDELIALVEAKAVETRKRYREQLTK